MSYIYSEKGAELSGEDELMEGFLLGTEGFLASLDQTTRIDFDQELLGLGWEQQTGCLHDPAEESSGWTDQILETINPSLNFPCESFPGDPLINGTTTSGAIYQTKSTKSTSGANYQTKSPSGAIYQTKSTKSTSGTIYQTKSTKCTGGGIYQTEDFLPLAGSTGVGGGACPPVDESEAKENLVTGVCEFPKESAADEDELKLPSNFILSEEYLLKCLANLKHFDCKKCGKTFQQKRSLVRHTRNVTNCQIVYQENQTNNANDKIHDYVKTIKEKSFETSDTYEINIAKNTQCEICRQHFGSVDKAQIHTEEHLISKQCCKCYKVFGNKSKLKTHHRSHTKERPFHCSFCEKTFTECSSLRKHILTHGNRHFTCDICGKKFIRKDYLKKHMNSPKCVMFDIVLDGNI